MKTLNDIKNLYMQKQKIYLPYDKDNKLKNKAITLITPNINSSIGLINHSLLITKNYRAYYIEKDLSYVLNHESNILDEDNSIILNENEINYDIKKKEEIIEEGFMFLEDTIYINRDYSILLEDGKKPSNYNAMLRKLLYKDRMRRPKEVFNIYNKIKEACPNINKTYISYNRYKNYNLFLDFYYYNETFFKNNIYRMNKGLDLYLEFLSRFLNDKRLTSLGYDNSLVIIPVHDWNKAVKSNDIRKYDESINPISIIYRLMRVNINKLKYTLSGKTFIFIGTNGYFKLNVNELEKSQIGKFGQYINKLKNIDYIPEEENEENSFSNISTNSKEIIAIDKIENDTKDIIKIHSLTGKVNSETEKKIKEKINTIAMTSKDEKEVEDKIDNDNELKSLLIQLSDEQDNSVKTSVVRSMRMNKLNKELMEKRVNGKTVEDMINKAKDDNIQLEKVEIPNIVTINEELNELTYPNFDKNFDVKDNVLLHLENIVKSNIAPIGIRDIKVENTTTSEDYIETMTVEMEDNSGDRFSIKLDLPIIEDDKHIVLRGNRKAINKQLFLLPVVKTNNDTVQIVTDYNKVFITRYGSKSYPVSDRLMKVFNKMLDGKEDKLYNIKTGNNTVINNNYILPIDYMDLSENISEISNNKISILFNQQYIRSKYQDYLEKRSDAYPIGFDKINNKLIYCKYDDIFSNKLLELLNSNNSKFEDVYNNTSVGKKYSYSRAKILARDIPLILVLSYLEGLIPVLVKAKINHRISYKKEKINKNKEDIIEFSDGYIIYELTYESSLLLNGLKDCPTNLYKIEDISNKSMYLDFLDLFGGRIIADGLNNYYERLIDPITRTVLIRYNLPTDFVELFIYAQNLLFDNSKKHHTDMNTYRVRSKEIISACAYKVLSSAMDKYCIEKKRGRKSKLVIKQSAVIDEILSLNITSDASVFSTILEAETLNTISTKGPNGLNVERAYSLDKRAFDPTMINLVAMSTGQGAGVGINRQTTIDMNVEGNRGYLKTTTNTDDINPIKSLSVIEALMPYGVTSDDPPRSSMNLSQGKHMMRVKQSEPLLVSTGVDQALPYLLSNTFSYKAKQDGKVLDMNDKYMILEYKDKSTDVILLEDKIYKNSGNGMFTLVKLDTNLKKGNRFKANEILAYDKSSYSTSTGINENVTATIGTFAKAAICSSEDTYEDAVRISNKLSYKMSSDVIAKKEVILDKASDILQIVNIGDYIQEGEPLMIFQNAFEEEDMNKLMRALSKDNEIISDIGRIPIKSKYTGIVQDIKIYRTIEKDSLSESIQKVINKVDKNRKQIKKVLDQYKPEESNKYMDSDRKLDATGKLKQASDGILIEFYIKYNDMMSVDDKLTFQYALKGIVKSIYPEGKEPYTDFRPDEKIDCMVGVISVDARQTTGIMNMLLLNKIIIEAGREIRNILKLPQIDPLSNED